MKGLSDKNATQLTPLKKTYSVADKKVTWESGKLWLLINGTVTMRDEGDNILFVTTGIKEVWLNEQAGFFPLVCDYQEKYYATGKIWGNRFMKREWRPSESATLTARMIDRPIRPMFPKWIINDTQVIATVFSSDGTKELGFWGITGASLGLLMAGAPFEGPVSAVKIALTQDGSYIYDPTEVEEDVAKLSLIVAGTIDAITMVEAGAKEISNTEMVDALAYAHTLIKTLCEAQLDYIADYKKAFWESKVTPSFNLPDSSLYAEVEKFLTMEKLEVLYNKGKKEFQKALNTLDVEVTEYLQENSLVPEELLESDPKLSFVWDLVYKRVKVVMRKNILENERRLDGRKLDEVREVIGEVWFLPRTHGSAMFQRGMTQVVNITTLGWPGDVQLVDGMMPESEKRYIHHYNFPPYSVWEVRMMRWVGRREIGHGRLAERALEPVLPSAENFPYMMRSVSEVTTCNGSSSMASVCGSSMSLMHAWVPLTAPVAGVAMGMIYDDETGAYKILSDIQAQEDFLWDMDFKVARTPKGITAMQLDVKVKGLAMNVFKEAFAQWETATSYILEQMWKVVSKPSEKLSPYAPLIMSMVVPQWKIREIIGKWWENIQRIQKEYGVDISIEDDGTTTITAETQAWGEKAIAEINEILWTPEVGYKDTGKVVKIIEWVGAIVEFKWKNSGMIHISKLSTERVTNIEDVVKKDDSVEFEIIQVDLMKGRIGMKLIKKL